jgi:replicative DNA helicase
MLEDPDLRVVWGMGEMSEDVLVRRLGVMGSELLELPSVTMADAKRTPRLLVPAVGEILERLKGRLSFVKSPLTIERLENQAIRTGSRLVVIDYLQLVEVDAPTQVDGLVQVATSVRRLASRRDVAVLAVSALAKNAHRDSRVGTICYGTSRFDYDADALFFGETLTEKGAPGPAEVRLVCKKQRNGVETNIDLFFDGPHQHFLRTPPAHDDFADFTGETTAAPRVPK